MNKFINFISLNILNLAAVWQRCVVLNFRFQSTQKFATLSIGIQHTTCAVVVSTTKLCVVYVLAAVVSRLRCSSNGFFVGKI